MEEIQNKILATEKKIAETEEYINKTNHGDEEAIRFYRAHLLELQMDKRQIQELLVVEKQMLLLAEKQKERNIVLASGQSTLAFPIP